jgi:hypothetical protein
MAMVGVTAATYGDLESVPLVTRRKYRDGLATIAREDEIALQSFVTTFYIARFAQALAKNRHDRRKLSRKAPEKPTVRCGVVPTVRNRKTDMRIAGVETEQTLS